MTRLWDEASIAYKIYGKFFEKLKEIPGIETAVYRIDVSDYKKYIKDAEYTRWPWYHAAGREKGRNFEEKTLEHYISLKLMDIRRDDVLVDIASAHSPFSVIVQGLYGCKVYKQDMILTTAMEKGVIGGDATQMPVEDGFATAMTLHCSLEHFDSDKDIALVREAARVLRKGGRICMLPVYMRDEHTIFTNPASKHSWVFTPGAKVIEDTTYPGGGFGRFYSPEEFKKRIIDNAQGLKVKLFWIENEKEVDESCYVKFACVLEKLA